MVPCLEDNSDNNCTAERPEGEMRKMEREMKLWKRYPSMRDVLIAPFSPERGDVWNGQQLIFYVCLSTNPAIRPRIKTN